MLFLMQKKYYQESSKVQYWDWYYSSYRHIHITVTCLADIIDEIRSRSGRNEAIRVIGMDLSKALDSMNHTSS